MSLFRKLMPKIAGAAVLLGAGSPASAEARSDEAVRANEERMAQSAEMAMERAIPHIQALTEANVGLWGQDKAAWSVDLDQGVIEFTNERGWLIKASVQVIGTYDANVGTFMWGWDHPSVPGPSSIAAKVVQEFGTKHDRAVMTQRVVEISEDDAWQYTGLAAYLTDAQGAYRGAAGTTFVYMTFGPVKISKP